LGPPEEWRERQRRFPRGMGDAEEGWKRRSFAGLGEGGEGSGLTPPAASFLFASLRATRARMLMLPPLTARAVPRAAPVAARGISACRAAAVSNRGTALVVGVGAHVRGPTSHAPFSWSGRRGAFATHAARMSGLSAAAPGGAAAGSAPPPSSAPAVVVVDGAVDRFSLSTAELYRSPVPVFAGPFAATRATLDYSWHVHYTAERQAVQDAIVEGFLSGGTSCDRPWLVYTAGPMGAGE
jgi:hypothetical protein